MNREFERWAGRPPSAVWSAPGRVNLIGEHTDYNDGFVLPVAIERAAVAAAARRRDGTVRFRSLQARGDEWLAYPNGVAWSLREAGVDLPGADVLVGSTVPQGAGLSSSAALEVAVALALLELAGRTLAPVDVALACRRAEEAVVGTPCGIMDQLTALLAEAGSGLFVDTRTLETARVPLGLGRAGIALAVIDTRVAHALRTGGYAQRRRECEQAARVLGVAALRDASAADVAAAAGALGPVLARRARHVVSENARVLEAVALLREGRVDELGAVLARGHASLRDDFEVSTPELDLAVDAALTAGAVGARMTGGGFGGSAIALVAHDRVAALNAAVAEAFARAGFAAPDVFTVTPGGGAWRLGP